MLAVLILAAAGTQAVSGLRPSGTPAADAQQRVDGGVEVAALEGASGRPTLLGRVREVRDPATVVVDVEGRPVTVTVIGLDISMLPDCALPEATAFARRTLNGESVTLVPDPTLPLDPAASTWPAYLVLGSQQSYTDAALRAGWADPGPGRYRSGFEFGRQQARNNDAGMWGPPCNRR